MRFQGNYFVTESSKIIRFVAVGALIQSTEFFVPYPIPGFKLGLANIITLLAVISFDFVSAFKVAFFRPIVASLVIGTFLSPTFVISFISSIISFFSMWLLKEFNKYIRLFSIVGISISGAVVHGFTQLVVVYLWLLNIPEIFYLAPFLVISCVVSGGIVGYSAGYLCSKIDFTKNSLEDISSGDLQKVGFIDKLRLLIVFILILMSIFVKQVLFYLSLNLLLFIAIIHKGFNKQVLKKYAKFLVIFFIFLIFPFVFGGEISDGVLYSNKIFFLFQISLWIAKRPLLPTILWLFGSSVIPVFLKNSTTIVTHSMFLIPNLTQSIKKPAKRSLKEILNKVAELL